VARAAWQQSALVVYWGWMVQHDEYAALARPIEHCGATPLTSPQEYLATHHLPNWFPLLADLAPETRVSKAASAFGESRNSSRSPNNATSFCAERRTLQQSERPFPI
jgi:hypothetical protein